jgi:hypothetical protein
MPFPFSVRIKQNEVVVFRQFRFPFAESRKHGIMDIETWKQRDKETRRRGAIETWRLGDAEMWRRGDVETRKHGDKGDMETWRCRDMETWMKIKQKTETEA